MAELAKDQGAEGQAHNEALLRLEERSGANAGDVIHFISGFLRLHIEPHNAHQVFRCLLFHHSFELLFDYNPRTACKLLYIREVH